MKFINITIIVFFTYIFILPLLAYFLEYIINIMLFIFKKIFNFLFYLIQNYPSIFEIYGIYSVRDFIMIFIMLFLIIFWLVTITPKGVE